jgi:RimJ/RimL family protein N-acetyltransferase
VDHPSIPFPDTLTDGELVLCAPTVADAEAHMAGEDDEMRRRFDSRRPATLQEMRAAMQRWVDLWTAGGPNFTYLAKLTDGRLVGGCEIRLEGCGRAGVSYWSYAGFRQQGYARRAMRLLLAAAAAQPGLEVLDAHVDPDNAASRRLAERLGFVEMGLADDVAWDGVVSRRIAYERPAAI